MLSADKEESPVFAENGTIGVICIHSIPQIYKNVPFTNVKNIPSKENEIITGDVGGVNPRFILFFSKRFSSGFDMVDPEECKQYIQVGDIHPNNYSIYRRTILFSEFLKGGCHGR